MLAASASPADNRDVSYVQLDDPINDTAASGEISRSSASTSTSSSKSPLAKETPCNYNVLVTTTNGEPTKGGLKFYRTKNFDPLLEFPPVSYTRSVINDLNSMIGTSVLTLPYAMKGVGLAAPLVMIVAAACICQSSIFMLESFHEDGDPNKKQLRFIYWHAGAAAFGSYGAVFIANVQRVSMVLGIGGALVAGSNVMDSFYELGSWWLFIFSFIIVIECTLCPNQNSLAWMSGMSIFNVLVCCCILLAISTSAAISEPSLWDSFKTWRVFEKSDFFESFNVMVLNFYSFFCLPNIYMEMAEKHRVKSMIGLVLLIAMISKLAFMVGVFYAFQSDTETIAILNVTNIYLRVILAATMVLYKLLTVPIWSYPNRIEMESFIRDNVKTSLSKYLRRNIVGRSLLTLVVSSLLLVPSVCMGLLLPEYWDYTVLMCCVIYTPLALVIPNMQWLILTKRKPIWKQILSIVIMLLGLVCSVGGAFQFQKNNDFQ